jgi:hypothetical protein
MDLGGAEELLLEYKEKMKSRPRNARYKKYSVTSTPAQAWREGAKPAGGSA